jgi:hypothetical protein
MKSIVRPKQYTLEYSGTQLHGQEHFHNLLFHKISRHCHHYRITTSMLNHGQLIIDVWLQQHNVLCHRVSCS